MARSRQHQSHSRALREFLSQPRKALLDSIEVIGLLAVEYVQKRIGTGGDHPDTILFVRLGVTTPDKIFTDIVEKMLEES